MGGEEGRTRILVYPPVTFSLSPSLCIRSPVEGAFGGVCICGYSGLALSRALALFAERLHIALLVSFFLAVRCLAFHSD